MNKICLIVIAMLITTTVHAGEIDLEKVKKALPNTTIDEIKPTAFSGLYEITAGKNVLYVDKDVKFLFVGGIYDLENDNNLTEARLRELNRIEFDELDLKNAIKIGKGERRVAIFYDPDCPYCRDQYQELKKANLTSYIFLYPLPMHPEAYQKTESIWCSEDKINTLESFLNGKQVNMSATCKTPINQNIATAEQLGIVATPTMILDSGEMISGFVTADNLMKKMGISDE